ncbi:putative ribonuclease H-like domain-containing protein [Tanacetum coccineum]
MVPRIILTRSGPISVNAVRLVNIVKSRTAMNNAVPKKNVINNAYSTARRPFNKITSANNSNFTKKVNTVKGTRVNTARPKAVLSAIKGNKGNAIKASACWVWRPAQSFRPCLQKQWCINGNPQQDLKDKGVIDIGCSRHMTGNKSYLTDYEEIDGGFVAFGNVYFVKELKFNLFSVSQMCDKKNSVLFTDTECVVLSPYFKLTDESHVLLKVPRKDNMYSVDLKNVIPQGGLTCLFLKATPDESNLWHRRLGHVNFKTMNKLVRGNLVRGLPLKLFEINQTCVACQKGKQHRASCKTKIVNSISQPLQILHMDLFGPTFVTSLMKKMYCLVVTDDFSIFSWVFFLTTKDETFKILKTFITCIENLIDLKVKVIRCDNGIEFKNRVMNQFCEIKGIKREFSVARTPQQNEVAERKNRTLIKDVRTMLADLKLPTTFWAEAVNTAYYVQNRVLVIKPQNKTPYELFLGRKPALSFIRPFGCPVTILNTIDHLGKFDGKADEGFFVGYSTNSKAFRVFNSRTRIVEENLHVQFSENTPNIGNQNPKRVMQVQRWHGGAVDVISHYVYQMTQQVTAILLPWLYASLLPLSLGDVNHQGRRKRRMSNMDIKSAFLYGKIKEEVYVYQPPGFEDPNFPNRVYKVGKALYGPHQALRAWYETLSTYLLDNGFQRGKIDKTLFIKRDKDSPTVNAASIEDNTVDENIVYGCANDPNIPDLEDISSSENDVVFGAEADMTNLDTHIPINPIPTTRIHKDHPVEQIIGDIHSAPQTRRMTKSVAEHAMFSSVQQRNNHKDIQNCMFACFLSQEEPKKVIQALKDPSWIKAMQDELLQNKKDERAIVINNKARLVAQGYTQEEGIDYDEVFALVVRIEAIRIFLASASFKDFVMYYMDVKSAFLYGKIEEEVYVCQPPGFEDPNFPDRVYKVEKEIYRLHQALRAWYETLSTYLLDNGFQRGKIDNTLFIRRDKGNILLIQVYVDDIIFGSTKKSLCTEFEKLMHKKFQMISMGELTFFLGLQVKKKEDGIFISQDKYMTEILKKFGFSDVKTASTPMETHKPLLKDADSEDVDEHLYRSMIRSLMYLTYSRPHIMFAVCACARFQVNPKISHLHAVKRIFRYLKGQPKLCLWYPKDSPFDLMAFTDSDYAGASLDRKSTIGAEYIAASICCGKVTVGVTTAEAHNMAAYLEKSIKNDDFVQIVDFLNAHSIRPKPSIGCLEWNEEAAKDEIRNGIRVNAGDSKLMAATAKLTEFTTS